MSPPRDDTIPTEAALPAGPRDPAAFYFRTADHPGEVWHPRRRQWVSDSDDEFTRWRDHPWAQIREFATTDELAAHLEHDAPGLEPQPSAARQRVLSIIADADRVALLDKLKNATLAEIETYVRNQINADAAVDLASARSCLKRIETAIVILAKAVALAV